jgi:ABC-type uncharacterized transport system permease subunit
MNISVRCREFGTYSYSIYSKGILRLVTYVIPLALIHVLIFEFLSKP